MKLRVTGLVGLASLLVLTGCANQTASNTVGPSHSAKIGHRTEALAGLIRDYSADFQVYDTPNSLAVVSKSVIEGVVDGYIEGRKWHFRGSEGGYQSTILRLKVTKVFKSKFSVGEFAFVELKESPGTQLAEFEAANPVGTVNLLFIEPAQVVSGPNIVLDSQANIPTGSQLFRSISPQGWAVSLPEEGTVVWPLLNEYDNEKISVEEPSA